MSHPQRAVLSAVEENDEWQPHAAEEFQQVGLVGRIAIGLLGASTVTHLLCTWSDWNTYGVVHTYLGGGPNVDDADLNRADSISRITSIPNVIISVAAAVVFVIWLWRARVNSEVFCQADHRRSHGWVLASWFCPGPNLVYPKQIVDDVWLASDPKTPVYADDLRRLRKPLLTTVWWVAWVGALAFDVVIRRLLMWMEASVGSLRGIAMAGTASLILTAVSAVAATMVIRKITTMQTNREWIPWWDQREPRISVVPSYAMADDDTSEQQAISEPIAAPALRIERQPALQLSGGSVDTGVEEAPKWSPFAPVAESWQDAGPATEQFSPIESWREDAGAVEEATPSYQQSASGLETPSWSASSSSYTPVSNEDLLSAPLPSWQAESVAPAEPSWSSSYSEPYTSYTSDYSYTPEPVVTPEPAPEPEPAPVARAGRRAARVAVDSPSTVQSAVTGSDSYYQQAPAVHEADDFLTPSKPLPPVPSFGPEPSYTPEPSYIPETPTYAPEPVYAPESSYSAEAPYTPEPTYAAYEAPAAAPSYEPPTYTSDYSSYEYSEPAAPELTTYAPETSYTSEYSYTPETPSYDSYAPESTSYDSSYQQSSYSGSDYSSETYSSDYSPNYTPESYSTDYNSTPDYNSSYSEQPATEYQPPQYSYEEPAAPEKDDSETTAPRTHPRRRWV